MKNFCYWQEDAPQTNNSIFKLQDEKICLLRLNEYKIQKELNLTKYGERNNILCPYTEKDKSNCYEYLLIKDVK